MHPISSNTVSRRASRICRGAFLATAISGLLQGCTTVEVSLRDGNTANQIHSNGTVFGNNYITADAEPGTHTSPGLHDVVIKDNLLYDLVGVLTLGVFSPHDVSYRNAKPIVDDSGNMGLAQPDDARRHARADLPAQPGPDDQSVSP